MFHHAFVGDTTQIILYWFDKWYNEDILNLLKDADNKEYFWNTLRIRPVAIQFNDKNEDHLAFTRVFNHFIKQMYASNSKKRKCFDKDTKLDIEVITAMAVIRCNNYGLPFKDRSFFHVQRIAGHITPSIITSAAVSSALNCLQLYAVAAEMNNPSFKVNMMKYNCDISLMGFSASHLSAYSIDKDKYISISIDGEMTVEALKIRIMAETGGGFDMGICSINIITPEKLIRATNSTDKLSTILHGLLPGTFRMMATHNMNPPTCCVMIRCEILCTAVQ